MKSATYHQDMLVKILNLLSEHCGGVWASDPVALKLMQRFWAPWNKL